MAIDENKQKALAAALGQIEKQFGKGSIMRPGEDRSMDVETISTGSLSLDIALGAGGLPMGRIVEIYGPESSGKTTLTLQVIAAARVKREKPVHLSMQNTHWTRSMPVSLALILITCCVLSRIPVSKRWKSVMRWRAPVRLTLSLSTPLPH